MKVLTPYMDVSYVFGCAHTIRPNDKNHNKSELHTKVEVSQKCGKYYVSFTKL